MTRWCNALFWQTVFHSVIQTEWAPRVNTVRVKRVNKIMIRVTMSFRWWSEALDFFSFSFGGRTGVKEHSITVHFNHRRYSNSKILENTLLIDIYRKMREIKEETIKWFRNMPPRIGRGHEWNGNGPWSWTYGPNILYFPCFIKSKFKKYMGLNWGWNRVGS